MSENVEDDEGNENEIESIPTSNERITEQDLLERRRAAEHEKGKFDPQLRSTIAGI